VTTFDFAHRHAKAILFSIAVITAAGIALAFYLPVSLFPDITFPRLVILADNGDQPAERIMIEVTKPLEEVASSIPGIKVVRSITGRGSTEISLLFNWGTDIPAALQMLQGRIAAARTSLPPTASVEAEQMSIAVFPILGYSLTSDSLSQVELRDIAYYQIRPAIMRVDGVARVMVTGGDTREFAVTVDPAKLAEYHLDIREVDDAVQKTNLIDATGLMDNNYQLYLSVVSGLVKNTDDIGAITVAVRNGVPIRIKDIAEVRPSTAPNFIRTTAHGKPAVLIDVIKQPTGSTVRIGSEVQATVAAMSLPKHVHFENWYDQGDFINSSIGSTRDSIFVGILLSMIVLIIFLRNWRVTLVMIVVVPVTIAATIVCLRAVGQTINIMTLGGIAAAVGLIIDDSIVVIERIFARQAQMQSDAGNRDPLIGNVSESLRELFPAIVGSTMSTVVINIPLLFLTGVTGAFFAPLAVTMIFALLSSFAFSITLTPLLISFILRSRFGAGTHEERHISRIARWYEQAISRLLRVRYVVIPAALAILAAAYFIYSRTGSGFLPDMDEGTFVLDYVSPAGTSLDETNRMLMQVEQILIDIPEVDSYSRRTGTQLGFFLTEPNTGDFLVKLKKDRSRSIDDVIADVRKKIEASIPSLEADFGQLMMDVIGDLTNNPKPIEIKLFGDDRKLSEERARAVAREIESIPGVVDVFDGIVVSGPSVVVNVDATKAALAGLTVEDVQAQLGTMMEGRAESRIQKGEKLIPIRVEFPGVYRREISKVEEVQLVSPSGVLVPLRNIASFEKTAGQTEIGREGLRQLVAVTARIENRDLGHTVADIKRRLAAAVNLPRGTSLEYGGVYQTQAESFRDLLLVALVAAMLVFIVLTFEFGELAAPLAVMMVSLLSLSGVVTALWITHITFNVSSFVGLIMIIGIVAENGIFVMHEVKREREAGYNLDAALVHAGQVRARPIIMTTLAAILALLPLALGLGAGAQMQQPLAIAVIGGFCVSSLLLFFVLPLLYRSMVRG
jgi:CzcA family heavy metal efflux pump